MNLTTSGSGAGAAPAPLTIVSAPHRATSTESTLDSSPSRLTPLVLVAMPWPPIYSPYLAISTLAACAKKARDDRPIEQHHLYLDWYATLLTEYGEFTSDLYSMIAESGAYSGVGDFIFAPGHVMPDSEIVAQYLEDVPLARDIPDLDGLLRIARRFVAEHAARMATTTPPGAFVGLSSTFSQTVPSIALAEALKKLRPDITLCFGGSNMSAPRADVLLRNYRFIDHVVFGEGETSLVELLRAHDAGGPCRNIPGVVNRQGGAGSLASHAPSFTQLDDWPPPDFDPYFEQLANTGVDTVVEPKLAYEIARGCWWGAKHHCTFCGLNGESMALRFAVSQATRRSPT